MELAKGTNVNLHSLVSDKSSSGEVLIKNDSGQLRHDGALIVSHDLRYTAIISKPNRHSDTKFQEVVNLVRSARVFQKLSNRVTLLQDTFLDETSLSPFDQIVLADDRIVNDFSAIFALRQWVSAGGRLWVLLDRVSPMVLESLMGDEFTGHVVDRVELTSVRVDKAPSLSDAESVASEVLNFEKPVDFVRTIVSNIEVTQFVDGWPAAMSKSFGDGKIIVTTLGPRAWMKPSDESSDQSKEVLATTNFIPTIPMRAIADTFLSARPTELLPSSSIESKSTNTSATAFFPGGSSSAPYWGSRSVFLSSVPG